MKLASFMERHAAALVIGSLGLGFSLLVVGLIGVAIIKEVLLQGLLFVVIGLGMVFTFVMPFIFAFGGSLMYSINNASLRRNGKRAPAVVLDSRWTGVTDSSGKDVTRFKLEVHPPDEAPFVAIAEDSYYMWDLIDGQEINVWYDPTTKDVALEKPKKIKQNNF
jgi:hypothetical protein